MATLGGGIPMGHDILPVSKCSYCVRPFQSHTKHRRHVSQHLRSLFATQSGSLQSLQALVVRGKQQPPQQDNFLFAVVEWLFGIRPLWEAARRKARDKIASRGEAIGVDMEADVAALRTAVPSWETELEAVESRLILPEYYTRPFHAYPDGNLCWEAAFEVPSVAKLVHAPVMDPENKVMDIEGDAQLRSSYSAKMHGFMQRINAPPIREAVNLGCATGLSTLELQRSFPEARIVGVDLSPHFLAVARVLQRQQQKDGSTETIEYRHAAAENTGLLNGSVNLVSACLLLHELPTHATTSVVREAHRLLRPGGILSIMEMNPASPRFKRICSNPFAYVPFKATEPWLVEYVTMDLTQLLEDNGFAGVMAEPSTPGHFTLVCQKLN